MKTCAISANDVLISIPATLRCCVKTRGQVQTHMPCPDARQQLQIYFKKHLVKDCLKGKSSCRRKSASLLAGLCSSNPRPWQDMHSVPGKWPCTLPHSPSDPSQFQNILLQEKFKCFNQIQKTHHQLTSPILPTSVSLKNKTRNTLQ